MLDTDNKRILSGRDEKGRFSQGNLGRPLGARGKASRAALEKIKAMQDGAIQKLWEAVTAKERWAIEFVLSKILPTSRTIEFEGLMTDDVVEALKVGDITPEEAKSISATLRNIHEMEMMENIEARLKELEEVAGDGRK